MAKKRKALAEGLFNKAAFMAVSLEELQQEINSEGFVEEYQNGANQSGIKKSAKVEIYNTMIKNYLQIIKQLNDMLPEGVAVESDGFDTFVNKRV